MIMKKYFKLIPVIFILVIIIILSGFLFSCGENKPADKNDPDNAPENQNAQNIPDNPENDVNLEDGEIPEKIAYDVPEMDCGEYTFTVVDRDGYLGVHWITVDMFAESENGDPINDAVFKRNRFLEDMFNINIVEVRREDVLSYVQKIIQSGSDDFDVMYPHMQQAANMIQKGQIYNLYEMPYLDFDKPWWDKVANDSMTIGGKLYGATGDITTMTNDATRTVLFNKDLNQQYALGDPYQLVKDGKWTLGALHENSRAATKDLNGDGIFEPEDQWGTVHQHECAYCLFAASGQKVIEKNTDDLPELALNSDRTVSVLGRVSEFMSDVTAQIKADDYTGKYKDVWSDVSIRTFDEDRALYMITNFDMVKLLRGMETNFGILPLPKYDETQEKYYNTVQYNNATVMCIPITALNIERSGAILEAWAAESVDTLTKAYYDITLKGKFSRDNESEDMLDLIFSTRVIDQGLYFNWSGMQGFFEDFSRKKNVEFASQYEKSEPKWAKEIDKTITAIEENN